MKVEILKTFVNENGTSFLKGRKIDVTEAEATVLEANGIISLTKADKPSKKKLTK